MLHTMQRKQILKTCWCGSYSRCCEGRKDTRMREGLGYRISSFNYMMMYIIFHASLYNLFHSRIPPRRLPYNNPWPGREVDRLGTSPHGLSRPACELFINTNAWFWIIMAFRKRNSHYEIVKQTCWQLKIKLYIKELSFKYYLDSWK